MQVRVEEEKVVIFPTVLLSKALLMEILEEIVNGLNRGQVCVWFSLLMAPKTRLPQLQLHLQQT